MDEENVRIKLEDKFQTPTVAKDSPSRLEPDFTPKFNVRRSATTQT